MYDNGNCWLWAGHVSKSGYGYLSAKVDGKWKNLRAHRVMYEAYKGEIPEGLVLDHLCRITQCVNPDHLEPVTQMVNTLRGLSWSGRNKRKTHCPQGHPYEGKHLTIKYDGARACLTCGRQYSRNRYTNMLRKQGKERIFPNGYPNRYD